jgi:hypothetical protein
MQSACLFRAGLILGRTRYWQYKHLNVADGYRGQSSLMLIQFDNGTIRERDLRSAITALTSPIGYLVGKIL